ncbi:hypothetical protein RvY_08511 [Ramazzottius varieornatus]|uniref:CUB domain-containing protein n=1 Tax=Ramazzottius varieornatus TaxID=947166 RepID=A0A1D1V659_RAMVA|nr:hypothetical protein RvY_08511 [Ramazzottius varieornatus]
MAKLLRLGALAGLLLVLSPVVFAQDANTPPTDTATPPADPAAVPATTPSPDPNASTGQTTPDASQASTTSPNPNQQQQQGGQQQQQQGQNELVVENPDYDYALPQSPWSADRKCTYRISEINCKGRMHAGTPWSNGQFQPYVEIEVSCPADRNVPFQAGPGPLTENLYLVIWDFEAEKSRVILPLRETPTATPRGGNKRFLVASRDTPGSSWAVYGTAWAWHEGWYNDIEFSRDIAFKRDVYLKAEDPYYFSWLPSDDFYGAVALYSDWNVSQMTPCSSQLYRYSDGSCNGFKSVPLDVSQIVDNPLLYDFVPVSCGAQSNKTFSKYPEMTFFNDITDSEIDLSISRVLKHENGDQGSQDQDNQQGQIGQGNQTQGGQSNQTSQGTQTSQWTPADQGNQTSQGDQAGQQQGGQQGSQQGSLAVQQSQSGQGQQYRYNSLKTSFVASLPTPGASNVPLSRAQECLNFQDGQQSTACRVPKVETKNPFLLVQRDNQWAQAAQRLVEKMFVIDQNKTSGGNDGGNQTNNGTAADAGSATTNTVAGAPTDSTTPTA